MKFYRKQLLEAEQFDGTQKMVNKYHISVYNENIDKYGGLGDWTPNEYTFNGTYIHVGDWIIECSGNIRLIMTNNKFKKDYAELPVIPKSWAGAIEEYKANHYRLEKIFTDALILNYDEQELIARAWLDGYEIDNKS